MSEALAAADRAQRQAADPAVSAFVTANAGSGKTKVLIDRVARLLLGGSAPQAFLCITYTKAAAAEMQRRLFERLGRWCVADDAALAAELERLGEADWRSPEALARARALFARALETPGGLKIQTIHAFCERLLRRFPLEAGVAPGFAVAEEAEAQRLLTAAWRRAAENETLRAPVERLAERYNAERFDALLACLARARGEIDALVTAAGGLAGVGAALAKRHGEMRTEAQIEAEGLSRAPWAALGDAAAICEAGTASDQKLAARLRAASRERTFAAYRDALLNDSGAPRRPTKKTCAAHPQVASLLDQEAARIEPLDAARRAAARVADTAAALTLGFEVERFYADFKRRRGALDFEDLILSARALLCDAPAAAWTLYKLDGGIDHILIDEGQDTSPAQWELLAPLQEEFFAGEGARRALRTVFAVGDAKQSIYSFQGAEPRRFLSEAQDIAQRADAAGHGFIAPELATSFRSAPEVLAAVDAVFARAPIAAHEPERSDVVRHLAARTGEAGLVEWWPIAPHPEKQQNEPWDAPLDQEEKDAAPARLARAIAAEIKGWIAERQGVWDKGALRPMHAGDVLILVQTRGKVFRAVLRALKRAGLPVAGADRMVLREELAVQDLLALAAVAIDPGDDLKLACVLKSPLVGLLDDDADLFPLAYGRPKGERLIDRLRAASDAKYAPAQALIEAAIARRGLAPFDFLAWALESLDTEGRSGWRRMLERLGLEARDPLEELLSRALDAPAQGKASLQAFVCAIENEAASVKREAEAAGAAIRVMTVHGAKGLEAPVVILADTTSEGAARGDDLMFGAEGPVLSPSSGEDDAFAARARLGLRQARDAERLRLLYVALTRARDRLIVCGHANGSGEGAPRPESWHTRVGEALAELGRSIETPFGEGRRLGAPLRATAPETVLAREVSAPDWARTQAPAEEGTPMRPVRKRRPSIDALPAVRRGRLIHGLLQRLPDVPEAQRRAAGRGWLARQGAASEEDCLEEALAVMAHPACRAAFGPGGRPERPIIGPSVRGVVDRLLITPTGIEVIEFKTDREGTAVWAEVPAAYRRQIEGYMRALAQAFPGREVRAALIWTAVPLVCPGPSFAAD